MKFDIYMNHFALNLMNKFLKKKSNKLFQIFFHILEAMKQIGSFLTLAYYIFFELEPYFPFIWKPTFSNARFEKVLKCTPHKL